MHLLMDRRASALFRVAERRNADGRTAELTNHARTHSPVTRHKIERPLLKFINFDRL